MRTRLLLGRTVITTEDAEHELSVFFNYSTWREGHPYGSTTAYEPMAEASDHVFELDGVEMQMEQLVAKFGQKMTDEAIERAENNGIENE